MIPLMMYMLESPMVFIQDTIAKGTATEMAFRIKAMPMKASAVSYLELVMGVSVRIGLGIPRGKCQ